MSTVYVFISTGRFRSFADLQEYIDPSYTADGGAIPSAFMGEVGLSGYEPACIEAIPSESGVSVRLADLLAGASFSDQWLPGLDGSRLADSAVCVFAPNLVRHPERCSLEYVGAFPYRP